MTIQDSQNSPPTAQTEYGDANMDHPADEDWLRLAKAAYGSSTSYVDSNYRKTWEDSIRAFNSLHPSDSKYNMPAYDKRSRLYRPKTRSIIRKNEAAAAAAFFSNMDTTSITATDQSSKVEMASAEIHKELLRYRLTKTIPWFQILLGGLQDAQTVGTVCAHVFWDYKAKPKAAKMVEPETTPEEETEYPQQSKLPAGAFVAGGEQPIPMQAAQPQEATAAPEDKPLTDKPVINLIPVENLRIDAGADWTDPINSSPFLIHLMPMYLMDVKDRMENGDWRPYGDGAIKASTQTKYDSTRSTRQQREDPYTSDSKTFSGYEICWVQRHIHRKDGEDWEFYTLGDFALLTSPRLLKETVLHGMRPYVMGCCIIEAHRVYPSGLPELGKDLQTEANEVANQRIDNVKFVLNKKFLVKRGKEADIAGLIRNVPGGVVMLDNPQEDVKEMSWPDVTASAYEEQSRIDNDMNDLLGNFSAGQVMADHGINGPARNMALLGQSSATLVEYLLRTFVETFVQPVLRQLIKLEQCYETDQVVLAIAAKKSNLMQKFGTDQITDELLEQELTLNVNVGMGATDPQMKLQKFTIAMQAFIQMMKEAPPGLNLQEVGKEIFGHMGYQDGSRFFTTDNPQVLQLQQKLQESGHLIQQLQMKVNDKQMAHDVKLKVAEYNNQTKLQTVSIQEDGENHRNVTTHLRAIMDAEKARTHEVNVKNLEHMHQRQMSSASQQHGEKLTMRDANERKQ